MGCAGGIILGELIEDLENRIDEYFGSVNEIRLGFRKVAADKPPELILYEQLIELQIPLIEGGLMDQPHIWIIQYATCKNRTAMWRSIMENAKPKGSSEAR